MIGWIDRAACRRFDPELFFPIGSGPASTRQAARAKAVCACCPVSEDCLALALRGGEVDGIWGGLDADERRARVDEVFPTGRAWRTSRSSWRTTVDSLTRHLGDDSRPGR